MAATLKRKREEEEEKRPSKRPARDEVYTPEELARDCIRIIPFVRGDTWLDGFCGKGVFFKNFPEGVHKTWTELQYGRDFLAYEQGPVDWVVSNPPFSEFLLDESLKKCARMCRKGFGLIMPCQSLNLKRLEWCGREGFRVTKLLLFDVKNLGGQGAAKTKSTWPKNGHFFVVWSRDEPPLFCVPPRGFEKGEREDLISYVMDCVPLAGTELILDPFFADSTLGCRQPRAGSRLCVNQELSDFLEIADTEGVDWIVTTGPSIGIMDTIRKCAQISRMGFGISMDSFSLYPGIVLQAEAEGFTLSRIAVIRTTGERMRVFLVFWRGKEARSVFALPPRSYQLTAEDAHWASPAGINYCV